VERQKGVAPAWGRGRLTCLWCRHGASRTCHRLRRFGQIVRSDAGRFGQIVQAWRMRCAIAPLGWSEQLRFSQSRRRSRHIAYRPILSSLPRRGPSPRAKPTGYHRSSRPASVCNSVRAAFRGPVDEVGRSPRAANGLRRGQRLLWDSGRLPRLLGPGV
jgi:hypothetical protein